MKPIFKSLIIVLFLNTTLSCNNDSSLDQDLTQTCQNLITEKNDSVQTFGYCYGCFPMISAYHDSYFNQFVIAWSGHTNHTAHPVTISYKVDKISGSKRLDDNNGDIRENVYAESYLATWSVRCSKYDCSSCSQSGSILKKSSGEIETGSIKACHKDYLSYSIENIYASNTFKLVLNDNDGNLLNTEKYMSIDGIRIYKIEGYPGTLQEIYGAGSLDTSLGANQLRFSLYSQEMFKNFRIVFYSSKCEHNYEHYLSADYRFSNSGVEISGLSLTLVKNH